MELKNDFKRVIETIQSCSSDCELQTGKRLSELFNQKYRNEKFKKILNGYISIQDTQIKINKLKKAGLI